MLVTPRMVATGQQQKTGKMQAAPDKPIVSSGKVESVDTKNGECGVTQTGPPVFRYSLNEQPKIHARYSLTCCTIRAAVDSATVSGLPRISVPLRPPQPSRLHDLLPPQGWLAGAVLRE
jgi:hypothetical protein